MTATHTLDWDHIWPDGKQSGVRLHLAKDGDRWEFVSAQMLTGTGPQPLSASDTADVRRSFEDNRDLDYPFDDEVTPKS